MGAFLEAPHMHSGVRTPSPRKGNQTSGDAVLTTDESAGRLPLSRKSALIRRSRISDDFDQRFLDRLTAELIALLDSKNCKEPCHVMVFGHGAPPTGSDATFREPTDAQELLRISRDLVGEFVGDRPSTLLSVRVLVAPPGCTAQQWHLDYRAHPGLDTHTVFLALTACTASNCTEVLMPHSDAVAEELERRFDEAAASEKRRVEVQRNDVEPQPLLIDKFGVACIATGRLPHRRGPTAASSHTRVVLNCDFTYCSSDAVNGFVDDDAVTASRLGGLVPRNVVDDLHQEVVIELV